MSSMEDRLRYEMAKVGRSLFLRGLSGGSSGNLSVRLPDGRLLVTPTGSGLGDLEPDRLSLLDAQGCLVSGPPPTKEVPMHLACYAADARHGAVVHLHSPYAVALSCLEGLDPADCLAPFTPYFVMRIGRLPLAPYRKPGSPAMGDDMRRLLPGHTAVLLANHGCTVCGASLAEAAANAEELEAAARLHFILAGHKARILGPEECVALRPSAKA